MILRRSLLPYLRALALVAITIAISPSTGCRRRDAAPPRKAATRQQVVSWIRKNAIPLKTVRAGSGFEDMRPLRSIFFGESAMPIWIVPDRYDMLVFVDKTSRAEAVRN